MRHHELRQKGESEKNYIKRIVKFPTLHFDVLVFSLFWYRYIKDQPILALINWIQKAFPESNWISHARWGWYLNKVPDHIDHVLKFRQASISTKKFAEWVIEENIFDAWRVFGEKPSPLAELFIELVLLQKGPNNKTSSRTKGNRGRWAERDKHKEQVEKVAKQLWKNDKFLSINDVIFSDEVNLIKKTNGGNYSEGTLRGWIKYLAPSNKPGRKPDKK